MITIKSLSQPDVRPIKENGELYRLNEDYTFTFQYGPNFYKCIIRKGFQYDGASVPRPFWSLIGLLPDGIHRPAALVHDWFYEHRGMVMCKGQGPFSNRFEGDEFAYDRKFADHFFYAALKYVGLKSWHAKLAYWAVRIGGRFYWRA